MHFATYLEGVALQAGLTLALALPVLLIAIWRSRTSRWGLLFFVALLVVLQASAWSWQESLLSSAWPFLLVALVPGISLASIGVASRFRSGWVKPTIVAGLVALAVPAVFFVIGARKKLDAEGWAFLLIMPVSPKNWDFGACTNPCEPGFRKTLAIGRRGVRMGINRYLYTVRRV